MSGADRLSMTIIISGEGVPKGEVTAEIDVLATASTVTMRELLLDVDVALLGLLLLVRPYPEYKDDPLAFLRHASILYPEKYPPLK